MRKILMGLCVVCGIASAGPVTTSVAKPAEQIDIPEELDHPELIDAAFMKKAPKKPAKKPATKCTASGKGCASASQCCSKSCKLPHIKGSNFPHACN
ncbi:MAG: hypothetical protein QM831_00275 [Kofleriaceae bacterium]